MLNAGRKQDEASGSHVERPVRTSERELGFEDLEHLVLGRARVVGRLFTQLGGVLEDRRSVRRPALAALHDEVDAVVVDPALPRPHESAPRRPSSCSRSRAPRRTGDTNLAALARRHTRRRQRTDTGRTQPAHGSGTPGGTGVPGTSSAPLPCSGTPPAPCALSERLPRAPRPLLPRPGSARRRRRCSRLRAACTARRGPVGDLGLIDDVGGHQPPGVACWSRRPACPLGGRSATPRRSPLRRDLRSVVRGPAGRR